MLETALNNSAGSSTGASNGAGANSVLGRIASGDRAAMRECLSLYGGLVWSMARTFTTNAADAEDAVQDVFIHLWQRAGAFDATKGSEVQFVSVVARRRLVDWVRRHVKQASKSLELLIDAASPKRVELDEQASKAWDALQGLAREQQQVLVLSIVYGLTHEQIATHLRMPLGTVKTNLYRGLQVVRDAILASSQSQARDGARSEVHQTAATLNKPAKSSGGAA